jgi:hypothetical protein
LVVSGILIAVNLSQVKRYQLSRRNETRTTDIDNIAKGIQNYVRNTKNLPTTSSPSKDSFLPEILFVGERPTGGVPISTLEDINGYNFDTNIKEPAGTPYFIGTFENKIIVYTTEFENKNSFGKETYYKSIEIESTQEVQSKL